jgi:hypothetical protein
MGNIGIGKLTGVEPPLLWIWDRNWQPRAAAKPEIERKFKGLEKTVALQKKFAVWSLLRNMNELTAKSEIEACIHPLKKEKLNPKNSNELF